MRTRRQPIIVASGSRAFRDRVVGALEEAGHACATASLEEVTGPIARGEVAAAVVDASGAEPSRLVAEVRRAAGEGAPLPLALVMGGRGATARGLAAGADDVIAAPVDAAELEARVRRVLELGRVRDQLRAVRSRDRELAALAVHDLRNPLTALYGNIQLLEEEAADTPELRDGALADCRALVEIALSRVAGLLDVDELEVGALVVEPRRVNVSAFVGELARRYRRVIDRRALSLECRVADDLEADLDDQLFGRVMENLLDNAVRYAPRGGRVVVSAELARGELVIVAGNDGPAVDEGERARIFDRYYRTEARREGARAGRGLGLYYCKLAAEGHGGSIAVERRPGLPACFVVRLPQPPPSAGELSAGRPGSP